MQGMNKSGMPWPNVKKRTTFMPTLLVVLKNASTSSRGPVVPLPSLPHSAFSSSWYSSATLALSHDYHPHPFLTHVPCLVDFTGTVTKALTYPLEYEGSAAATVDKLLASYGSKGQVRLFGRGRRRGYLRSGRPCNNKQRGEDRKETRLHRP